MKFFLILLSSLLLSLFACKQTRSTETTPIINPTTTEAPQPFVSMSKTPCYGKCPSYTLTIFNNGHLVYHGKRFVEKEGIYDGTITADQLTLIKEKIDAVHFFELSSKYDNQATDIPSCIIEVNLNGKTKKITDRVGAPKELKELEKLIEELVFNAELKKAEE